MSSTFRFLSVALSLGAAACTKKEEPPPAEPAAPVVARTIGEAPDHYLTRGDARLRYREAGQGTPVVLIHGYTQRIEGLAPLADSLSGSYRVIVPDLRGFGESTKYGDPARYGRAFGDDVIALLDSLGVRKAHLVGHSMGAQIAVDLALRYPDRVSSISLISGPFFADSAATMKALGRFLPPLEKDNDLKPFVAWLVPGTPDSMVAAFDQQLKAGNDHGSLVASLQAIGGLAVPKGITLDSTFPVVIAVGTKDPLLPQSRALKARWPSATLIEVAADHFDVISKAEVISAIRAVVGS